jgi:hypothetical protein
MLINKNKVVNIKIFIKKESETNAKRQEKPLKILFGEGCYILSLSFLHFAE